MPRAPRVEFKGAVYHVMARGNRREPIVFVDSDRELFVDTFGEVCEKTRLEVVDTMLERKTRMAELSDSFVSLPGGMGTMDELFEMVTWGLLGLHGQKPKPNGILNVAGYYDSLIDFIQSDMVGNGFLKARHASNLVSADDFPDLLERMRQIDLVSKIEQ